MKKHGIIVAGLICLFIIKIQAQSSLKRSKQVHRFHYLQANLHLGYLVANETNHFDLSPSGPKNRLVYQYFSKNQRLLQKGYTRNIALSSFKSRISLDLTGTLEDPSTLSYQLKLQNVGLSFNTKWDRTKLFIGYANIKLGHNPKIDPVTSFIANSLRLDLGFTQDLGFAFKTAISEKFDFEGALYTGGVFRSPLITYTPWRSDEQGMMANTFEYIDPKYNSSWLGTSRLGSPQFKSLEYGVIAMVGKIGNGINERFLTRIGADIVKKVGEKFKLEGQIHGGSNSYMETENSMDIALQNNLEVYVKSMFIVSTSNAILFSFQDTSRQSRTKGNLVNSLSYVVSPHTRVRVNHFLNYGNSGNKNWGITFQLVTGIGKR